MSLAQIPAASPQPPISQNDPGVPPVNPANLEDQKRAAPKFAALIRKEKQALEKLRAATAKEQSIVAREEAIRQREARLTEFETVKQNSPLKALEMLGYNYNQLSEAMLNEGKPSPDMQISRIQSEMETWKQQQAVKEAESKKIAEQQSVAEQKEILEAFQTEIGSFVENNKTDYQFINLYGQSRLVYSTIDDHYNKTGKIASIKEACDHVEKYLEAEVEKALQIEKFRQKVNPTPQKMDTSRDSWGTPKPAASKTLSNAMSPAAPPEPPKRRMSEDEMIRRAVDRVWGSR